MKVNRSKSAASGGTVKSPDKGVARRSSATNTDRISPTAAMDGMSFLGIPEAELTPKVRSAIMGLLQDVDRLRQEVAIGRAQVIQLEQLADQDALVPLANRRSFVRELSRMISFAQRYKIPSSLLYFDINGLKTVNDTLGHAAGDAVIKQIATTLISNVRQSDLVGRLGGDEFAVLLTHSDERAAENKAAALARNVELQPFTWEGQTLTLSIAYGSYTFKDGEDAAIALDAADRAMYARKQESRQHR